MSDENAILSHLREIRTDIELIKQTQQQMANDQSEIKSNLSKIKDIIYDPDRGIYARLKVVETKQNHSEKEKEKQQSRIQTLSIFSITSIIGLVLREVWATIFNGG